MDLRMNRRYSLDRNQDFPFLDVYFQDLAIRIIKSASQLVIQS